MTVRITKWLMAAATIVLIAWDVYVAANAKKGDTISEVQLRWAWEWQCLPVAWGVVCGHLFWPLPNVQHKWERLGVLWILGFLIVVFDPHIRSIMPLWPFLGGVLAGHLLWPQKEA